MRTLQPRCQVHCRFGCRHRRRLRYDRDLPTQRLVLGAAAIAAVIVLVTAQPGHAQEPPTPPVSALGGSMPRFEVGGNVSGLVAPGGGVFAPGIRLGLNLSPRWAVEGSIDSMRIEFNDRSSDIRWLYLLQAKHTIKPGPTPGDGVFLTYGGAGGFSYHRWKRQQIPLGDGRTLITPEATEWELSWPFFVTAGAGYQRKLASWAVFRVDAQVLADPRGGFATRFTGGITIPLGGFGK